MIEPEVLADDLQDVAVLLRANGGATWGRCDDWETARMPRPVEPSDDEQEEAERAGRSEVDEDDRRDDAAASRYRAELNAVTKRLTADAARLKTIMAVCNPPRPKRLANRDLLLAQVAAEGWCTSCWRDEENLTAITLRPEKDPMKKRHPFYRDTCRDCGDYKKEHGQYPPKMLLELWHAPGGKARVTVADMAKALGRTG